MVDSLFILSALLLVGSAHAQVSAPNCTDSSFAWSFNSIGQGPCLVAAYLASPCNNGAFTVPALLPQHSYTGPNGADDGDLCKCNTVIYNLLSACDACQGEPWIPYSGWASNCTSVAIAGSYPETIPAQTRVPQWAYLDPTVADSWNITEARLVGDTPEGTGTATNVQSSTRNSQSTITPQKTTSAVSSSSSPSKGSSNTAAIAGGVVGGVVGAALIAAVVAWFTIRRRRARSAHSGVYGDGRGYMEQTGMSYPLALETPRLYDPSDPSTYPPQAPSPTIHTTNHSSHFPGSDPDLRTNRQAYTGLPEL